MDFETTRLLKRGLPVYTALAATLLILTIAMILRLGRDIFVPIALAVLLSFVLAPGVRALQRIAVKQSLAVIIVVLLAFGAITGLAVAVGSQIAGLGADLPRYQETIRSKISNIGGKVAPSGTFTRAMEALDEIGTELQNLSRSRSPVATNGDKIADPKPMPVVVQESGGFLGTLNLVVSPLLHPLATAALVVLLVLFVLAAREDLRNRLVRLLGTDDIQRTTEVIDEAARRLSRLFLAQLALNATFGTIVSIGLWLIGVPSPLLWGIFAGILRFVPYVGGIAGVLPPLLLSFAIDPGWSMLLQTAAFFAILSPTLSQIVEPTLLGQRTGLTPIAVVISASLWTFLWGPIGLVLSTPLTVCLVVIGRHVGRLGFLDIMLGDRPALSPPQLFYQRMLAGDPTEAVIKAKEFLRERALATYYDEVALEGLRLAHQDVARGRLSPERLRIMLHATDRLIDRLGLLRDPRPKGGGQVGAEAAAAVIAAGPDQKVAVEVLSRQQLKPAWRGSSPVACFARPGTLDEVIAKMLTQVLVKHGIGCTTFAIGTQTDEAELRAALPNDVRLIFLSYIDPLSTLHLRHAVKMARREFAGAGVVLGIWRERDAAMGRQLSHAARADLMVPTIGSALAFVSSAGRA
ncbi:MAG: AI-2E family transporter [Bradyrhizobiaceae bacterium]|nr:MAG: AI-2E family transporter [Bradyrhizobiaceae bacterium]